MGHYRCRYSCGDHCLHDHRNVKCQCFQYRRVAYSLGYETDGLLCRKDSSNWGTPANTIFFNLTWGVILTFEWIFWHPDRYTDLCHMVLLRHERTGCYAFAHTHARYPRVYKPFCIPGPLLCLWCFVLVICLRAFTMIYMTMRLEKASSYVPYSEAWSLSGLVFFSNRKWIKLKNAKEQPMKIRLYFASK